MNEESENYKEEIKQLEKAGKSHFFLLLSCVILSALVFVVPDTLKVYLMFAAGANILLFGISFINLTHFQRCPKCKARIHSINATCSACGISLFSKPVSEENVKKWFQ